MTVGEYEPIPEGWSWQEGTTLADVDEDPAGYTGDAGLVSVWRYASEPDRLSVVVPDPLCPDEFHGADAPVAVVLATLVRVYGEQAVMDWVRAVADEVDRG
jgi:hypothetical protein